MGIIGDIKGKTCIVNDDMIDTAGTLCGSTSRSSRRWVLATSTSAPPTVSSPAPPSSAWRRPPSRSASSPTSSPVEVANVEGSKIKSITHCQRARRGHLQRLHERARLQHLRWRPQPVVDPRIAVGKGTPALPLGFHARSPLCAFAPSGESGGRPRCGWLQPFLAFGGRGSLCR